MSGFFFNHFTGDNNVTIRNYARFEFCTFRGNNATDFAAALSFITAEIFRSRERDKPFQIANWCVCYMTKVESILFLRNLISHILYSNFTDNVHRDSTTFGVAFIPVDFEGHTVFESCTGVAVQVSNISEHYCKYLLTCFSTMLVPASSWQDQS